jgi:hypothetical protein
LKEKLFFGEIIVFSLTEREKDRQTDRQQEKQKERDIQRES